MTKLFILVLTFLSINLLKAQSYAGIMKRLFTTILTIMSFVAMATTHTINAGNMYYSPSSLTINVNDSVIWSRLRC